MINATPLAVANPAALDPTIAQTYGVQAPDGSMELCWDATTQDPSTFSVFTSVVLPSEMLVNSKVHW